MTNKQLPSEEIMRQMSKIAMEQATLFFAKQARDFALSLTPDITGPQALKAFANAIESTNKKVWPTSEITHD